MINLPFAIFLNAGLHDGFCRSGDMAGLAQFAVASEEVTFGMQNINRTLYTITVDAADFPNAKERSEFEMNGVTYVAVKPPTIEQDSLVFVCAKK